LASRLVVNQLFFVRVEVPENSVKSELLDW